MLRSKEVVTIRGIKLERWIAERLGLMPVTIQRCFDVLSGTEVSPAHFLFWYQDLQRLFPADRYANPQNDIVWCGLAKVKDVTGESCMGFWPTYM